MTTLNGYIQGLGSGADRIVRKTGKEIKLSAYDNIDRIIVFNEAGETSQAGTPTPSDPVNIVGIGTKQLDGTYKVSIDYWDDDRDGRITASGLAYPLYEGDILDFANGKVIRANGYVDLGSLTWVSENSTVTGLARAHVTGFKWQSNIFCEYFIYSSVTSYSRVNNGEIALTNSESTPILRIRWEDWGSYSDAQIKTALDGVIAVYKLASPVEEYITIEGGDIADIGTARVEADGTLTVKYDKVEMAIRKYSSPPDWQKIGYTDTPQIILDAFDYSKRIYDTWTPSASYASAYRGDKELKYFPDVDLTGATNYSAMFQESGIQFTEPLTIGDDSNTAVNCQWMFQTSPIEDIEITNDSETQKVVLDSAFKNCSNLKKAKLNLSATGSMASAFADCTRLKRIEDGLDTSSVTSFSEAFRACSSLLYLYELDLSSCTTCYRAFQNCTSLYSAPYLNNIRTGGNFQQMFWNCSSLRILPPYNLKSPSNLTNMFQGTGSNLEEASRINILFMLAGCTYSGTKTLAHLGFTASMYSAASWQALPTYNDFVSAGWSIGYN